MEFAKGLIDLGGSGSPLVCLHGATDTWHTWDPIAAGLASRHRLYASALPGHMYGPSLPTRPELTFGTFADAVEHDLELAGITPAHLVGNSLGGWIALELATRGHAHSVVALSPIGGWDPGGDDERRLITAFQKSYASARLLARFAELVARLPGTRAMGLREVVSQPSNISPNTFARMIRGVAECSAIPAILDLVRSGDGSFDLHGPINAPVRLAWGTDDRLVPYSTCSLRFRTMVPNAEFIDLKGVGHVPMSDDPDLILSTILELTDRVDKSVEAGDG
jgi:pimeloyl-ACP methyl ester carboxylesterase